MQVRIRTGRWRLLAQGQVLKRLPEPARVPPQHLPVRAHRHRLRARLALQPREVVNGVPAGNATVRTAVLFWTNDCKNCAHLTQGTVDAQQPHLWLCSIGETSVMPPPLRRSKTPN